MQVKIRRQRRKTMMIRPVVGGLEVFIPHWLDASDPAVQRFIARGRRELAAHVPITPPEQTSEAALREMVRVWAAEIGVAPKRVQIRQMYRKWGSCSSRGTITLNRALCWLPHHLAEYVVVHELIHLIELSHNEKFWALMTQFIPDWQARQDAIHSDYSPFGEG
jgi:predicted metal-dependent hydrolase